jgi:hypothetical protein
VLGAVPPAPVAALGDQQLFIGQTAAVFRHVGGGLVGFPRAQELAPGLVILLRADPDVEVGVDPGPREWQA